MNSKKEIISELKKKSVLNLLNNISKEHKSKIRRISEERALNLFSWGRI